jgi:acetyl esterase/lipase
VQGRLRSEQNNHQLIGLVRAGPAAGFTSTAIRTTGRTRGIDTMRISTGKCLVLLTLIGFCAAAYVRAAGYTSRTVTYKRVGALEIKADVYTPQTGASHPAILWIHGGALIFGDRTMLPPAQRDLYLAAGYSVVSIDYRLAPETKLALILEDISDAYAWLLASSKELGIAKERVSVVGHSAGGYLALMAGVRFRPRPRAVISFYGYGDIAGEWYSRPDPYYLTQPVVSREEAWRTVGRQPVSEGDEARRFVFYRYCRQNGLWPELVCGHNPRKEPQAFDAFCPVRNVDPGYPPTLLVHGSKDSDVPAEQSSEMARALAAKSVPHKLIILDGYDHVFDIEGMGMSDPAVQRMFQQVLSFLDRYGVR